MIPYPSKTTPIEIIDTAAQVFFRFIVKEIFSQKNRGYMVSINSYLTLYFITLFSSLLELLLDFTNYFSQYFDLKIKYLCNVGISGKSFHFPIGQANVASLVCILTFNFQKCTYIIMKLCQFLIFNNTINRFIFYWFKIIRAFTKCSDFFK